MFKGLSQGQFPTILPPPQHGWPARSHWLLVGLCAVIFAILMPREEAFPYRFQQGQPWSYRSLHAPFDFEVMYPEEQVRNELARVNAEHAPYFRLDPEVSRLQKNRFEQLVAEQVKISRHDTQFDDLVRNQATYTAFGEQLLDLIYSQGIADPTEEAFKDTPGFIYLMSGNTEKKVRVQEVGTINRARDFLTDTLPFSPLRQPEIILPLLEKSLVINVQYSDSLTIIHKRRKLAAVMGTGIMVHKGELIVQPGEIVSAEAAQKLHSLEGRYQSEQGPFVIPGMGLLALLVFAALLWSAQSEIPNERRVFPFLCISVLLLSLGVGWLGRVGEAVPLLLPLWALPLLFRQTINRHAQGTYLWLAVMFLTMFALNWASGWLAIQAAGFVSALFFLEKQRSWKARALATIVVWVVQIVTLTGLDFSGQLPGTMRWADGAIFLLLGVLLSFVVYPLRRFVEQQTGNTVEWDVDEGDAD